VPDDVIRDQIARSLREAGYDHRLVRPELTADLEAILTGLCEQCLLSDTVYGEGGHRESFTFSCPAEVSTVRTLIVVAWSSQPVKVRFHLEGGPLEAVIPPTYIHTQERERCMGVLRSILEPAGFSVGVATGPAKLLAVYSGLARYGRNNHTYVRGMGTFARLEVFCTDADLGAVDYQLAGSPRLSLCPACCNCSHVCPTGCIPENGTVIDGARCLAFFNEGEGEWPEWLDIRAHNSLVGCMRCQALCPANRTFSRLPKVVAEFDRAETDVILQDLPADELPEALRTRLAALDLDGYSKVLGRNLRALSEAAAAGPLYPR
jgi:epoxyqueuosine reductase